MPSRFLRGRLFRNLLFWAYILYSTFANSEPHHKLPAQSYYSFIALALVILVAMSYTNTLWLAPRLLTRRRYWIYFPAVVALAWTAGLLYTLTIKAYIPKFPVLEIQQPAMIHTPVSSHWSLQAVLADTESHFGFFLLAWIIPFTLAWYVAHSARQARAVHEAGERQTALELSALKGQLHPHFLFNTLNNLYGLASMQSEKTPGAILKLSELLRYLLYDSAADVVTFGAESNAVQAYADLERLRLDEAATVTIHTHGPHDTPVPPLLWLPVLENAFKHGTHFIGGPYEIRFHMSVSDGQLRIECHNRYKPGAANGDSGNGIGLGNLQKRLNYLFPKRHCLQTTTEEDIFELRFTAKLANP